MGLLSVEAGTKPVHLTLSRDRVRALKQGSPWVYADSLKELPPARAGTLALIKTKEGDIIAKGMYDPGAGGRQLQSLGFPETQSARPIQLENRIPFDLIRMGRMLLDLRSWAPAQELLMCGYKRPPTSPAFVKQGVGAPSCSLSFFWHLYSTPCCNSTPDCVPHP